VRVSGGFGLLSVIVWAASVQLFVRTVVVVVVLLSAPGSLVLCVCVRAGMRLHVGGGVCVACAARGACVLVLGVVRQVCNRPFWRRGRDVGPT
jgi:hypothetical protein